MEFKDNSLLTTSNPLEERLGSAFFENLPNQPGVYKMISDASRVIYVGKAKNIRKRLFNYRQRQGSRKGKTRRMIRYTADIELELFDHERDALLRENELLRTLKPKYNVAKTHPESYYFLGLQHEQNCLIFELTREYVPDRYKWIFGAFKGHRLIRQGMGALLRLLWIIHNPAKSAFSFPPVLTRNLTAEYFELYANKDWTDQNVKEHVQLISRFLGGEKDELIRFIMQQVRERELLDDFLGKLILEDLNKVKQFYDRGPRKNYLMYKNLGLQSPCIPQNQLDDCLVRYAFIDEKKES